MIHFNVIIIYGVLMFFMIWTVNVFYEMNKWNEVNPNHGVQIINILTYEFNATTKSWTALDITLLFSVEKLSGPKSK